MHHCPKYIRVPDPHAFLLRMLSEMLWILLTTDRKKYQGGRPLFGYIGADSSPHEVLRQVRLVADLHTNDSTSFIKPLSPNEKAYGKKRV